MLSKIVQKRPFFFTISTIDINKKIMPLNQSLRFLKPYIIPNDRETRQCLVRSLSFLLVNKSLYACMPFIVKEGINALALGTPAFAYAGLCFASYAMARVSLVLTNECKNYIGASVIQKAVKKIATNSFQKLHDLEYAFHLQSSKETVFTIHRAFGSFETITRILLNNLTPLAIELSIALGILGIYCGPQYLVTTLATLGSYTVFTSWYSEQRRIFFRDLRKQQTMCNIIMQESIQNYETVKYFNQQEVEKERFSNILTEQNKHALVVAKTLGVLNFGQACIFNLGLGVNLLLALQGMQSGVMTVGDLVMIQTLMLQLQMPLNVMGTIYRELQESMLDVNELIEVQQRKSLFTESPDAKPFILSNGDIEFRNVTLNQGSQRVLDNVSFKIQGGKKTAIVGESGCGKTTIFRLLFRLFDPDQGDIFIDGQNIKQLTLDSLTKAFTIVPQLPYLFNDTVLYNLKFGKQNATMEEIYEVCQRVNMHDKILMLRNGYDTQVGDLGQMLSGGERQRIAIARAMLKNSKIYLLDEVTSAMDAENESIIQKSLDGINATLIYVAHRLSSIVDADQIIVFETGGKVVEIGTHKELIANPNSKYSYLWKKFMKEKSEDEQKEYEKKLLQKKKIENIDLKSCAMKTSACSCPHK